MPDNIKQTDIDRIKQSLVPDLAEMIEKAFDKQDKRLTALFDKDFGYMKETLDQHKNWHSDHFKKDDKLLERQTANKEALEKQITDSRISTIKELEGSIVAVESAIKESIKINTEKDEQRDIAISELSQRITVIESESRGKHSLIAIVIAVIGAVAAIGAIIIEWPK